jgi:lipopolysaccharide export system permease protein
MNTSPRGRPHVFLPIVGKHLAGEFLRLLALTVGTFLVIYVVADFFDRFDTFIKHEAPLGAIARVFLFKVPLILTQVMPVAVLAAALVSLGLLARNNEFVALRACGVSVWQLAMPLLSLAAAISVATFVWNEIVVPYSARRWHTIDSQEIKKRGAQSVFMGRQIWFHGRAGFYNVGRVSGRHQTLYGLSVYQLGTDFRPTRLIEADAASWTGSGWQLVGVRTREFGPEGVRESPQAPPGFTLPETLDDFQVVSLEPEELSYGLLRRQIKDLRHKGVDSSESLVDLHLKLALPVASFMMMLLAVPLAVVGTRLTSLAASIGVGLVVGFGYFVLIAFARALGQSGALPPAVAAWAANAIFALIGGFYLLGSH